MGKLLVTVFAFAPAPLQITNARKPGHPHLPTIKTLHQDYFLASGQLFVANAAPVSAFQLCYPDYFVHPSKLVPRHSVNAPAYAMTAKTRAIPSSHRDYFSAKAPGPVTGCFVG
jgi:hypothetical protein